MIDFAQQHLAFGGKRGIAVARGMDLGLGVVAGLLNLRLPDRAVDGDLQQRNEIAPDVLHQVIGGARLQRSDGDIRILRRGDEHHRWRIGDRQDPVQRFEAVETRHVLVERHDIDASLPQPIEAMLAAGGMDDAKARSRQAAFDQSRQRVIVVDIQKGGLGGGHGAACGTWMTEKNSPSWRMALAKFS